MNGRRLVVLAFAVAAVLGGSTVAQGSSTLGSTTLNRDVVYNLAGATLLGSMPASQQVTVGVVLSNPNQAAENAYLASLYDPSSSNYQNFLDVDTFNQMFGVPASTVSAASSWLTAGGLSVSQPEGATTYLLASGTSAQVSALFATPLNLYSAGSRTFFANAVAPTVPSGCRSLAARAERLRVLRHAAARHVRDTDVHDRCADRRGERAEHVPPQPEDALVDL